MLMLETCGTWHEMGGQIAEAFKPWFDPVLERFAPWLSREPDKFRSAIARLRRLVLEYVPYVEEETQGMAAALGWDADVMLAVKHSQRGKGLVQLVCDDTGGSLLLEMTSGQPVTVTPRWPDRDWQACSNFCQSRGLTPDAGRRQIHGGYRVLERR